ncbi:hypothetical protein WN55_07115 [Dufourea novaeangliae]|uniref:Uncharacterized protein n=1 Tax=Dufourea novaeangliae TaxID=178035 RepID=A0A154P262_DUFNO|nr:hypothetical protein WN55_07115 [Dufourea novaeangliae]
MSPGCLLGFETEPESTEIPAKHGWRLVSNSSLRENSDKRKKERKTENIH